MAELKLSVEKARTILHGLSLAALQNRGVTEYFSEQKPLPDVVDLPKPSTSNIGKHFAISEFVCHCRGRRADKIDPKLIELLEQLRAKAGKPIHVKCGYRCPSHNAEVDGVPNNQHILGTADDITIPNIGFERTAQLVRSLAFDGIGYYAPLESGGVWFLHVEVREGRIGSHIEWDS